MLRALAFALLYASSANARHLPAIGLRPPLVIHLEGRFEPDREHAQAHGADAVSVRVGDRERWFSAEKARTLGANQTLDGRAVLAMLAPIHPNLIAVGSAELRKRLATVPVGTPVAFEGLVNRSSRTLLLRNVVVRTPPSP